jgi:S-adenosylmethionine decarboxylase
LKALGKHIIVELYECNREVLDQKEKVADVILESVKMSGATLLHPFFHKFSPQGVSGVAVIAESHFSIHTWPEYGYAAIDIFTCGEDINPDVAVSYMKDHFQAQKMQILELKRGALDIPPECLRHKQGYKAETKHFALQGHASV